MSNPELLCLVAGFSLYVISAFLAARPSRSRLSFIFLTAGLLLQATSAGIRWAAIGHPPIFGTYEATLACSWFILLFTAFSYRSVHSYFNLLTYTTVPIALLLILYGFKFNTGRIPLTISERSLWVDFHALFAWFAFSGYVSAFCLAATYLASSRAHQGPRDQESSIVPSSEILDDLVFRYINIGFVNHTVMFALGSYYATILYGVWWQWDIVNSLSLVTWLSYGLITHMRLFYSWKGRTTAKLAVISFLTAIVSYWGLLYFPLESTYHIFDLEYKMHG